MTKPTSTPILQGLRRLVEDSGPGVPDQVLLHRLVAGQDATAFDHVLRRHGPMVLGVCRSVLRNEADAEDAFQASFLVFARKAVCIRQATSLASWLHGVAYRTALKARAELAIRRKHEARVPPPPPTGSAEDLPWREVRHILHAELNALPAKYRGPMVLCYLQGKTQDEAADDLGLAKGTLKGRLEKGRAMLRKRLVRRGLGAAGLLIASAWPAALQAVDVVRPVLQVSTLNTAIALMAGKPLTGLVSAEILTLTEGVVKAMFMRRLGTATVLTSGILLIAIVVVLGVQAVSADPSAVSRAKAHTSGSTEPPGTKQAPGKKPPVSRETPWGKEANGLSTRLVLVGSAKVGEPLTVKLEMKNVAQEERTYDSQQAAVNGSLDVTGPDGKPVPYIDLSYQTAGSPKVLKAGQTATIFETLDVANQYLLDQPGVYTIKFRGQGAFHRETAMPPSNELSVTLERGTVPPHAAIYRRLLTVAPQEWQLSKSGTAYFLSRIPPSGLKKDIVTVQLWFTKEKKSGFEDREQAPANLEYLGETTLGHAWLSADEGVKAHWPKYGTDLRTVVKDFRKGDASEKK